MPGSQRNSEVGDKMEFANAADPKPNNVLQYRRRVNNKRILVNGMATGQTGGQAHVTLQSTAKNESGTFESKTRQQ